MLLALLRCSRYRLRSHHQPITVVKRSQHLSHQRGEDVREAFLERSTGASPLADAGVKRTLFRFPQIARADDLPGLAQRTVNRAQLIVQRICVLPQLLAEHGSSKEAALLETAKQFDRLSDLLCGVIDLCEFVRNVHSDSDWVEAANWTYENMCGYMNELNTHIGLHNTLSVVLKPFRESTVPIELYAAHQVSMQFLRDFEKSGIHLPEGQRQQFVKLSDLAIILGRQLVQPDSTANAKVLLSKDEAKAIKNRDLLEYSGGKTFFDAGTVDAYELLRNSSHRGLRQKIWTGQNISSAERIKDLSNLLKTRAEIASLVGKSSWSHVALDDKMVNHPGDLISSAVFHD